jgi:WD40 repeat protein
MKETKDKSGAVPLKAGPVQSNSFFTSYPIFSLGTDGQGLLITGGGGGGRAYGVLNFLQAHVAILCPSRKLTLETIATLDTGCDAPMSLDFHPAQGGVWACALGPNCMLFKFNDDSLSIEPLSKWKSEKSGNDLHITNFVKIFQLAGGNNYPMQVLTGGEDKIVRLWTVVQEKGPGSRISDVSLVKEFSDHNAEVIDADWQPSGQHFLTCGKDGTVRVWSAYNHQQVVVIQPRSIDKKLANEPLSLRSAFFVGSDVVVLCHHPRGPAFLMLFSLANPATPVSALKVSRTITPSVGISQNRDKIVVSHAGGEKDIYAVPSLRLLHKSNKHSHEMPPAKSMFAFDDLVVSASPDFSLNFFDPKSKSGCGFFALLLLVVLILLIVAAIFAFLPEAKTFILSRHVEL